ncbi:XRE family transcriptional regulator [Streptacidiphilus pinicola]|uniref:XRE family transcriptional regulator n=1 Tax=Streptacidiphilus pinicola TaxID=2219663 RepID=A0A2X0IKW3_9ACTN|nr:XRE family transcriptional regulator [Streptacidiphilus pinicola]RAG85754.1 XRE family transcriptional regulator [Streptacidiphilus pinicola]
MEEITDALTRRDLEHLTRPLPTQPRKQVQELMRAEKQDKARVAARLGTTKRTVERYLAGTLQHPQRALREALDREVAKTWQPVVRRRARRQAAASGGITVETRARFGYTAPVGSSDDPRERRLTVHLPPDYAARLFEAQERGVSDRQLREIVAEGLQESYFKDGGRAQGLRVEFTDVAYFDVRF